MGLAHFLSCPFPNVIGNKDCGVDCWGITVYGFVLLAVVTTLGADHTGFCTSVIGPMSPALSRSHWWRSTFSTPLLLILYVVVWSTITRYAILNCFSCFLYFLILNVVRCEESNENVINRKGYEVFLTPITTLLKGNVGNRWQWTTEVREWVYVTYTGKIASEGLGPYYAISFVV